MSSQSQAREALAAAGDESQYLTFRLGTEMFGIGILSIREIIEYGEITEVPMMPAFVRGVINLRGSVVPVIDLLARFGRTPSEVGKRTGIVILELESDGALTQIGVIVDEVSEVLEIPAEDIEPPPAFGARIRTEFITGMGKVHGRFVILIDVARAVDVVELASLAAVSDDAVAEPA